MTNGRLYNFDNFFHENFWPESFFVNDYPVLVILWNILLLFIPFLLCVYLIKFWQRSGFRKLWQKTLALFLGFLLLIFIPNTAYIITDVRHLAKYCPISSASHICPENVWMIMFFFVYAIFGWVALVVLLNQMKKFIIEIRSRKIGDIFIWLIIPLISLGVLLGLVSRFNSWEFFLYPTAILESMLVYFIDFVYFMNWLAFTAGLYILYFFGNWLFKDIVNRRQ